ncbi:hypoxia up-regulated protein 1-like [Paramacrobiotus metropolitanus]|uniref:hypoxia up-regulated protein 1-like n=1 Tax=Paramacrobiotus metropolitanus TaxID=2943436 RepID=UPI002445EB5D|nr:hypoxia up-regulated protein 1-like [Paramacrobiotus metropolitanus]
MDLRNFFLVICVFGLSWRSTSALATMSIDLSSEFLKIAIVKPGVPMEIALNSESQRKTPLAVAIRNGERTFGEAALSTCVRSPKNCFVFFLDLLGKNVSHPLTQLYRERFPQYDLVDDPVSKRVAFKIDSDTQFSPEELLAMILKYAKTLAEKYAEHPMSEAVIAVPPYFTQIERLAIEEAARLAGLKILQLLNDNTAAAVNYGVFRRKEMNATMQHIMIYDMGSTGTTATVVGYELNKPKEGGENAVLHVKGVGYDRTLGGLEIDLRLRQLFVKKFLEKTKKDASKNPQALVKLLKEAARVKKVLSANTEFVAQVEGLMDDVDFSYKVLRSELESTCEDVFNHIPRVVEQALEASAVPLEEIQQIIIIGGGTRIPKVQEKLLTAVKRSELQKNLNSDEAIALGAVYQAAHLSKGFKVKAFEITDAVVIPIAVQFERGSSKEGAEANAESTNRLVKRVLFARSNSYPQRKVLTFPKHTADFKFTVQYAEHDFLSATEQAYIANGLDFQIDLQGVAEAFEKNKEKRSKGVKAHFQLDASGIFSLDNAEVVFEFEKEQEIPSTMEKIGQSITNFFSGSQSNDSAASNATESANADVNAATGVESALNGTEKPTEDTGKVFSTTVVNKTVTTKEKLKHGVTRMDFAEYKEKEFQQSKKRLSAMDDKDREKMEREKARNVLETYIFDIQDKIYQPAYEKVSTENERESVLKVFREASDWLEEESSIQAASVYKSKLKTLEAAIKDIADRVLEHKKRPEVLSDMAKSIDLAKTFLEVMSNGSLDGVFTEVEVEGLKKLIKETEEWRTTNVGLQEKSPLTSAPVFKVADVVEKGKTLDREVQYLLNKLKITKTKAKADKASKEKKTDGSAKSENGTSAAEDAARESNASGQEDNNPVEEGSEDTIQKEENENQSANQTVAEGEESITHSPEEL